MTKKPLVTVQIVTYNSEKDIEKCLESIYKQTYKDIEVIILDNNSVDNTVEIIENSLYRDDVKLKKYNENLGFCKAHNILFDIGIGSYVLVLNPDIELEKKYIENIITYIEQKNIYNHNLVSMVTGKLFRMNENNEKTNIIDTTGIIMNKSKRAFDRGQGEVDEGQYDYLEEVFGCCGAAVLYSRMFLNFSKINGEYFDEDFFAYKEDVDLSWRGNLLGYKSYFVPNAVGYHKRGWKNRKDIKDFLKVHSMKNRLLMIVKNEQLKDIPKDIIHIILTEIAILGYVIFTEPKNLIYIIEFIKKIPKALKKRSEILRKIKDRKTI